MPDVDTAVLVANLRLLALSVQQHARIRVSDVTNLALLAAHRLETLHSLEKRLAQQRSAAGRKRWTTIDRVTRRAMMTRVSHARQLPTSSSAAR